MNSAPLVSVIIPCYNYGRYLGDALESILAQSYQHWECIVIDDGSTDNTREAAHQYVQKDTRIKYIYQQNGGVSSARNRALKEAAGKYIQLLDADDMLEEDKLRLQVAFLEENPKVDLVYSNMTFFRDGDKSVLSESKLLLNKKPVSSGGELLLDSLLEDNLFLPGCTVAKKELYNDTGLFKKGIEGIEDWDYFYRAALLQKVFYHDDREGTRLLVRSHTDNASGNRLKMLTNKIKARKGLMCATENILAGNNNPCFSKQFIEKANQLHKGYLNRDLARLNLFYGSVIAGSVNVLKHAWYSRKPFFAFYDGAYWIKERIKKRYQRINK